MINIDNDAYDKKAEHCCLISKNDEMSMVPVSHLFC